MSWWALVILGGVSFFTHCVAFKLGYADCYQTQCVPLIDAIRQWKLKRQGGFDEPPSSPTTEPCSPDSHHTQG